MKSTLESKELLVSVLRLQSLSTWVRLGCSSSERAQPQEVRWTLEFKFESLPLAAKTDHLEETICYARVSDLLTEVSHKQEYATVEKLAFEAFRRVKDHVSLPHRLSLQVHKVHPPIAHLNEGVTFNLSERAQGV